MEGPGAPANPTGPPPPSPCVECGRNPWKYRCPGCYVLTCSLPCVKSHKQRTGCTGQKDRSQVVPLSQFDDNLLISDFNFLEETKRVAESARRMRSEFGRGPYFKLSFNLRQLQNAAYRRKTRLLLLSAGMSKREKNQSRYNKRSKSILWTIEWQFHSTNVILIDHGVNERNSLISMIERHLKPGPWNHQLRPFCNEQLDSLKFFLQKNPKGPKSPFRKLDVKIPIGQQMADVTIVEYPVIHVFLPAHSYDFEVEKVEKPFSKNEKPLESLNNKPSPKGVLFREEEIEDDGTYPDTHVMDLMDCINSKPGDHFQSSKDITVAGKAVDVSDMEMSRQVAKSSAVVSGNKSRACANEVSDKHSKCSADSLNLFAGTTFNFEQDLRDAYSLMIGEMNPDDFLCSDGENGEEGEMVERKLVPSDFGGELMVDDELEEGEIPSYG